ncbi:hypothetical protein [Treponema sp.]|uniref:hypothetical protein n=1 Tax=Treponema sp. TaxID=166 RepID=UPI0025D8E7F4|nr:hypothetical protein [Treponema sp.]MCR5218928.1 hypothetical protein [Treponema sp.]
MKVKFIILAASLFASASLFADDPKVKNPGKNEVIIVGRVVVTPKEDMEFIADTRKVAEEDRGKAGTYHIPFAPEDPDDFDDDLEDFDDDNKKVFFSDGEFFYARYQVNSKTRNLRFPAVFRYYFFDSIDTAIYLPFDINVDVPKGVSAMYIGSFYYTTTGNDFMVSCNHVDEYDLAQEFLDKVTKKHFDLYRADIKENVYED